MKGEDVMRHQDGLWNVIWSVIIIETTYEIWQTTGWNKWSHNKAKIRVKSKNICLYERPPHTTNCITTLQYLLDLDSQDNNLLINIYSGEIAHDQCND